MAGNSDRVIAHCPIPSESTQNNVWGEVHVMNNDGFFIESAILYGADGYVLPLPDPDTADSIDDIWDRLVDKDSAVANAALDIDTTSIVGSPSFEAGELDLNALADMHSFDDDNHWYKRRKILSFANSPTGFHWVTGGVSTFSPRDLFKVRSRRSIRSELHAESLFGMTIPALTSTTSTVPNTPADEAAWLSEKYLEIILEQAWMFLVGLVETGAETPWTDAATFVEGLLEPAPFEDDTGAWLTDTLRVFSTWTFDITVPGRREFNIISAS